MAGEFAVGFRSLSTELTDVPLPVEGTLPAWLEGRLLRNGPAQFEIAGKRCNHWFDGLAMLHRFQIGDGKVVYRNRFLKSKQYEAATERQTFAYDQFGTNPQRGWVGTLLTTLDYALSYGNNNVVNFGVFGGAFVAISETPLAVEFNPDTLETVGPLDLGWNLLVMTDLAHPLYDDTRQQVVGVGTFILPGLSRYKVWTLPFGSRKRTILAEIPVDDPAFIHSFGLSENYVIVIEPPLVCSPSHLVVSQITGIPFIANFRWSPDRLTRWHVVDRNTGEICGRFTSPPFFFFHTIQATEDLGTGTLQVDVIGYNDATVVEATYLSSLLGPNGGVISHATARRYTVPIRGEGGLPDPRILSDAHIEMPWTSAPGAHAPYRWLWGLSYDKPGDFQNQIIKIDTHDERRAKNTKRWQVRGCYPSEPIFVPRPGATDDDDGVLLSVVVDGRNQTSFLLVLDAATLEEVARALVPHVIPFGLHGAWNSHFSPQG